MLGPQHLSVVTSSSNSCTSKGSKTSSWNPEDAGEMLLLLKQKAGRAFPPVPLQRASDRDALAPCG